MENSNTNQFISPKFKNTAHFLDKFITINTNSHSPGDNIIKDENKGILSTNIFKTLHNNTSLSNDHKKLQIKSVKSTMNRKSFPLSLQIKSTQQNLLKKDNSNSNRNFNNSNGFQTKNNTFKKNVLPSNKNLMPNYNLNYFQDKTKSKSSKLMKQNLSNIVIGNKNGINLINSPINVTSNKNNKEETNKLNKNLNNTRINYLSKPKAKSSVSDDKFTTRSSNTPNNQIIKKVKLENFNTNNNNLNEVSDLTIKKNIPSGKIKNILANNDLTKKEILTKEYNTGKHNEKLNLNELDSLMFQETPLSKMNTSDNKGDINQVLSCFNSTNNVNNNTYNSNNSKNNHIKNSNSLPKINKEVNVITNVYKHENIPRTEFLKNKYKILIEQYFLH